MGGVGCNIVAQGHGHGRIRAFHVGAAAAEQNLPAPVVDDAAAKRIVIPLFAISWRNHIGVAQKEDERRSAAAGCKQIGAAFLIVIGDVKTAAVQLLGNEP